MMLVDREFKENYPDLYCEATGEYFTKLIKSAQEHDATIQRFGRYPHRNEILNRESTPEEIDYLKNGADTYGQ